MFGAIINFSLITEDAMGIIIIVVYYYGSFL